MVAMHTQRRSRPLAMRVQRPHWTKDTGHRFRRATKRSFGHATVRSKTHAIAAESEAGCRECRALFR